MKPETPEQEENLPNSPAKKRKVKLADESSKYELRVVNKRAETGLQIVEHRLEDKSIRLVNTSSESIDLGNWYLLSYLNGNEAIRYKFHPAAQIGPDAEMILWSEWSPCGRHYPPHDFIITSNYRRDYGEIFVWEMLNEWDVVGDVLRCPNGQVKKIILKKNNCFKRVINSFFVAF